MKKTIRKFSVKKLNTISKKKEVWCFGCGKKFNDILQMYSKELFVERITTLIDSSDLIQGKEMLINRKKITVESPSQAFNKKTKDVILLITSDHYDEIFEEIKDRLNEKKIICSVYPTYFYNYSKLLLKVMKLFSFKKQMLFCAGEEPHENALAIIKYLEETNNTEWKVIVLDENNKNNRKKPDYGNIKIKIIDKNALKTRNSFWENIKYCYYIATSRYLFYENEPLHKIRKEQRLIYLNHGVLPLKNVSDVLRQSKDVDYGLCPSNNCSSIYKTQYGIDEQKQLYIIPPRINFLGEHKLDKIIKSEGKQVIIWLPTFRRLKNSNRNDSSSLDIISFFSSKKDIDEIDNILKKNGQILLIKLHPREKDKLILPKDCENILLIADELLKSENITLQEILSDTSALITDYSGIAFEYLLLNKPIGYVINDMEDYFRGFSVNNPMEYMAGEKIITLKDLIEFLNNVRFHKDEYQEERNKLIDKIYQGNQFENGAKMLIEILEVL